MGRELVRTLRGRIERRRALRQEGRVASSTSAQVVVATWTGGRDWGPGVGAGMGNSAETAVAGGFGVVWGQG